MKRSQQNSLRRNSKDEKAFEKLSGIIEEIERSEFKYRQIFELAPEAFVLLDKNGILLEVNDRLKDFLGYEPEEVIGANLIALPFLPEHSRKKVMEMFARRIKGEQLSPYALDFTTKDGENRVGWIRATPLKNDKDEVVVDLVMISDITGQKEAELRLERFFEMSKDMLCVAGVDGYFKQINPAFEATLGFSSAEILSTPYLDLIHPEDRQKTAAEIQKLASGGNTFDFQCRFICKKGLVKWLSWSATPVVEEGLLYAVARDVTESKRAEQVLKESEKRFRVLADSAPVLIWMSGPDKLCTYFNKNWLDFTGRTMDEELGFGWVEGVHLEDNDRCLETYTRAFDLRESFRMEYRLRRGNGDYGWLLDIGVPRFAEDGEFSGYIGSCMDITESKRAEEELRKLSQAVEYSPSSVVITDCEGRIEYVNPKFTEITGYKSEEVLGENPNILKSGKQSAGFYKNLWSTIESGREWHGEFHNRKKSGECFWEYASISSVKNADGKITHFVGLKEDITERKLAEEALRSSEEKLVGVLNAATQVSIIATDPEGVITVFNSGAERMLGYKAEELVGKVNPGIMHLGSEVEAHGRELSKEFKTKVEEFDVFVARARRGEYEELEWTYVRKDGSHIWVSLIVTAIKDEKDNITGFLGVAQDITERKRAEEDLRDSEEKFGAIVNNVIASIVTTDKNGIIEFCNPATSQLFGYQPGELIGKNVKILVPGPFNADHDKYIDDYKRTGKAKIIGIGRECIGKRKDGTTFPIDLAVTKMAIGEERKFVGIVRDITERKQSEKLIQEFKTTLDKTLDCVFMFDAEQMKFFYVNQGGMDQLGYSREELLRMTPLDIKPEFTGEKFLKLVKPLLKGTKASITFETVHQHKHGSLIPVEIFLQHITAPDESGRFVAIVRDISERKKTEERQAALRNEMEKLVKRLYRKTGELDTILSSTADAIVVFDSDLKVTLANPAFSSLTGLKKQAVIGKKCDELMRCKQTETDNYCDECELLLESFKSGLVTDGKSLIENTEGSQITVQSVNSPLKNTEGKIVGVVKTLRDISKEAEIERMKDDFMSTVSHELRTPLTSITGYVDLILGGETGDINDLQKEFLETVSSNTLRLGNLINDLLDIQKIESGRIDVNFGPVDLSELIRYSIKTMQAQADQKQLKLSADIEQEITISGDCDRLTQVLINLLSNAIKFTREGGVTVELKESGDKIIIAVQDTGVGISRENQKKLFTRFFRADDKYVKSVGGTGLGLSIVKAIVDKHDGEIKLKSKVDQGTRIEILLPADIEEERRESRTDVQD